MFSAVICVYPRSFRGSSMDVESCVKYFNLAYTMYSFTTNYQCILLHNQCSETGIIPETHALKEASKLKMDFGPSVRLGTSE